MCAKFERKIFSLEPSIWSHRIVLFICLYDSACTPFVLAFYMRAQATSSDLHYNRCDMRETSNEMGKNREAKEDVCVCTCTCSIVVSTCVQWRCSLRILHTHGWTQHSSPKLRLGRIILFTIFIIIIIASWLPPDSYSFLCIFRTHTLRPTLGGILRRKLLCMIKVATETRKWNIKFLSLRAPQAATRARGHWTPYEDVVATRTHSATRFVFQATAKCFAEMMSTVDRVACVTLQRA